jgi:uncharacterized membrane protein
VTLSSAHAVEQRAIFSSTLMTVFIILILLVAAALRFYQLAETEFALRIVATFASVLSIAFTFTIGRLLYSAGAGLIAALFVGLNTLSIYFAQEAQLYSLLALWSAAGIWALITLLQMATGRRALLLALINAAGLYTHYAYAFLLFAQLALAALWFIGRARQHGWLAIRQTVIWFVAANLLSLALCLPILPSAWAKLTLMPGADTSTTFAEILGVVLNYLTFGITSQNAALAIPEILLLFGLLRSGQRKPMDGWRLLVPVIWVLVPVFMIIVGGFYHPQDWQILLIPQIGLALWMARGVWVLAMLTPRASWGKRYLWFVPRLAAVLSVLWTLNALWSGIPLLYSDPRYQHPDACVEHTQGEMLADYTECSE